MIVVNSTVTFPSINTFAWYLYHGYAYRPDVKFPFPPDHFMDTVVETPLHLDRTSGYFPPVCKPASLIVADDAMGFFAGLPNIGFAECRIARLAKVPFDPAKDRRISFDHVPFDVSPEIFHDCFPIDTDARPPRYHELRVHRLAVIAPAAEQTPVYEGIDDGGEVCFETRIDPEILGQYPIVLTFGGLVFRDDVYDSVKHLMPFPYFSTYRLRPMTGSS